MEISKPIILVTKAQLKPEFNSKFADWQAKINSLIVGSDGFVSLEIQSPQSSEWVIIQRFEDHQKMVQWRDCKIRQGLVHELKEFTEQKIEEKELHTAAFPQAGVTEVFITEVSPDKNKAYREWIAKIHCEEAKFPGFKGIYVQSPIEGQSKNWMTFLQFDTPIHLDRWLNSSERAKIMAESESLIASIESHRVISPYAGWFTSLSKEGNSVPVWKQAMLVLLVLYPIVMFELKFLSPITSPLDLSIATFIGNALSVSLLSWVFLPIAIWGLGWWLVPSRNNTLRTLVGLCAVWILYLIEIILFWKFV